MYHFVGFLALFTKRNGLEMQRFIKKRRRQILHVPLKIGRAIQHDGHRLGSGSLKRAAWERLRRNTLQTLQPEVLRIPNMEEGQLGRRKTALHPALLVRFGERGKSIGHPAVCPKVVAGIIGVYFFHFQIFTIFFTKLLPPDFKRSQ